MIRSETGPSRTVEGTATALTDRSSFDVLEKREIASLPRNPITAIPDIEIPGIVQEIIQAQPQTRFGRVHLREYGAFSLDYEIVYFMLTSDYNVFMDTQQAINLGILKCFAEEGIELPYPTQTVFVAQPSEDSPT